MIIHISRLSILAALFLLASMGCGHHSASSQTDSKPASATSPAQGAITKDVPERIDAAAKYLFYLHGRIIEERGIRPTSERWGVYEYEEMLEAFKARGLVVISEPRPRGTEIERYAAKVIDQIQTLIRAGVA